MAVPNQWAKQSLVIALCALLTTWTPGVLSVALIVSGCGGGGSDGGSGGGPTDDFVGLVGPSDPGGLGGPAPGTVFVWEGTQWYGECVRSVREYFAKLTINIPFLGASGGAHLLWTDPTKRPDPSKMTRIPWSSSITPQHGDLVVFSAWTGNPYGHVAVADTVDMTKRTLLITDSNWIAPLAGGQHTISLDDSRLLGLYRPVSALTVDTLARLGDLVVDVAVTASGAMFITTRGAPSGSPLGALWEVPTPGATPVKHFEGHLLGGLSLDEAGRRLFIAVPGENRIVVLDLGGGGVSDFAGVGAAGASVDGTSALACMFQQPADVWWDAPNLRLIVVDTGNHAVRTVSGGTLGTLAGTGQAGHDGDGGAPERARLTFPGSIASVERDVFYLSDSGDRIRRVGGGSISTLTLSQPIRPRALAFVGRDLVFTDADRHVVRTIVGSTVAVLAGGDGVAGDADGPAATARFEEPWGLTLAGRRLLVAGGRNLAVRSVGDF